MLRSLRDVSASWPASIRLAIISFLSLYFEVALIRWLPSEIRILAYFTNFTLISCVLGLGIGAIIARRKSLPLSTFPVLFAFLVLPARIYAGFAIPTTFSSAGYFVWNGLSRIHGSFLQYPVMFAFFILNTFLFVPLGQMLGKEFEQIRALRAYTINVLGALAGVGVFALFAYWQTPPWVWFAFGTLLFLTVVTFDRAAVLASVLLLAIAAIMIEPSTYWSPYYKINVVAFDTRRPPTVANEIGPTYIVGSEIAVNDDSHQQAVDLSGKFDFIPECKTRRSVYDQPYAWGHNDRILILGAGTGNDVAAALRAGAKSVDAVEIDPVILSLGRKLHPERPYADPRVHVHIQDARTFLRASGEQYDKIVLGYVDSHALFSAMSSVRLDNFVYTREFFTEMRQHLRGDGILSVTFTIREKWIADRLYSLINDAFGKPPLVFQGKSTRSPGTVFLASAAQDLRTPVFSAFVPFAKTPNASTIWNYGTERDEGYLSPAVFGNTPVVPSDDWPYLYLRDKTIPLNYVACLLVLLLFSYFFVTGAIGKGGIKWHFFFLGAGFFILETKAMTELAIFLGSTWIVNSFVIAAVLSLILAANWFVSKGWLTGTGKVYALLVASLLASYFAPLNGLLVWHSFLRNWVAVFILCLPMFFAGIIFARELQNETNSAAALGANLLGAVLGGMVEYASMAFGLRTLYLFAIVLYLISYACIAVPGSSRSLLSSRLLAWSRVTGVNQ